MSFHTNMLNRQVAFNFVISEEIPKVSHSTHVSKYFLVTYTSLMLSIVENVVAFVLANDASMEAAKILDWTFLAVYGAIVVTYSLVLVIIGTRKGKKLPHQFPPEKRPAARTNGGSALLSTVH